MTRFRLAAAGLLAAVLSMVAVAGPAAATTGVLAVGQVVKVSTSTTSYTITKITTDKHRGKVVSGKDSKGNALYECYTDVKTGTTSSTTRYYISGKNITVYKIACSAPLPASVRWA